MDDDDGRYLVSLAELKLLGEFVRWQDIDNRLAELSRERLAPRAYPRFKCRFQPDIWIDVLVDSRWRKVEFVSLASDELRYLDQGREFTLRVTEYNTAPAGYFTDYFDESLQVNEVELLDSFKYPFPALSASFYVETQSAA